MTLKIEHFNSLNYTGKFLVIKLNNFTLFPFQDW